jgi:hypothetical protein
LLLSQLFLLLAQDLRYETSAFQSLLMIWYWLMR